jgi:dUTPase
MKDDFSAFEKEKEAAQLNLIEPARDDISVTVRYSVIHPSCFHPSKQRDSIGIDIPIQQDLELNPNSHMTVDTGVQLFIPGNLCAQLIPHSSSSRVSLYIHSGFIDSNYSSTIKLIIRNDSQSRMKIEAGTPLVQALIFPILHPNLQHESSAGLNSQHLEHGADDSQLDADESDSSVFHSSAGSSSIHAALNNIQLKCMPTSYLHMMCAEKAPSSLHLLESNTTILLPEAEDSRDSIFSELTQLESQAIRGILDDKMAPISFPSPDPKFQNPGFHQGLDESNCLSTQHCGHHS